MKKSFVLGLLIAMGLVASTCMAETTAGADISGLEDQRMLINSLKKFVDDNPTAADEMEYVIQKKEDSARKKMNDMLEKMATDKAPAPTEALSGGTLDYISRHLNLALVYFYEAKYWLTIEECNTVIKVEPKNTLSWIRRGSAYYMLGQYEQAKKDWTLAMSLEPKKSEKTDLARFLVKLDNLVANEN
jgi:tetratricopeptide (TPR) repeat protein